MPGFWGACEEEGEVSNRTSPPAAIFSPSVLGSDPYIQVKSYDAGWLHLVCKSVGWFPKPWAEWRDPSGRMFPSVSEDFSLDEAGFFRTAVFSRIQEDMVGNVTCTIRNLALGQEKTTAMVIEGTWQLHKKYLFQ